MRLKMARKGAAGQVELALAFDLHGDDEPVLGILFARRPHQRRKSALVDQAVFLALR